MNKQKSFVVMVVAALVWFLTLGCLIANAETMTFSWTANPPGTDGYTMHMDDIADEPVADDIPRETETYTLIKDLEGECHTVWLTAYEGVNKQNRSANSDVAIVCPVNVNPPFVFRTQLPGGFKVLVTNE